MKYSKNFDRDFNWFIRMRNFFDFDGTSSLKKPLFYSKKVEIYSSLHGKNNFTLFDTIAWNTFKDRYPNICNDSGLNANVKFPIVGLSTDWNFNLLLEDQVVFDKNGADGKRAFYENDANGKIMPTKHPNILMTLLLVKGGVNLHIKMYAEDRASGIFPGLEFRALCIKLKAPYWFREAVENQKLKYW